MTKSDLESQEKMRENLRRMIKLLRTATFALPLKILHIEVGCCKAIMDQTFSLYTPTDSDWEKTAFVLF